MQGGLFSFTNFQKTGIELYIFGNLFFEFHCWDASMDAKIVHCMPEWGL